jgi:nucleoid-associated protein YgaU
MSKAQLEKASITALAGANANKVIKVLFNPTEYSLEKTNAYKTVPIPGIGSPLIQFVNGECDQLSLDLFLDDYTDPSGPTSQLQKEEAPVAKRLRAISDLMEIDRDLHAPTPVRFQWGAMQFVAVIEKLGRKVTMFHPDGTPARATLSISFKEYKTLREQLQDPRRESMDKSKRRVLVGNSQLWHIAAREYDSPKEWVRIAAANDLDDPREIKPGDWLLLPPVEVAA